MDLTRSSVARGRASGVAGHFCAVFGLIVALLLVPRSARGDDPADGAVALSYSRSPDVVGCSQSTEAELRDLIRGIARTDPFVPPGESAAFSLKVAITLPKPTVVRARFSVFDKAGVSRGVTVVEDLTCDGAQLKLAASIALLLRPQAQAQEQPPACPECPPPVCDAQCRAGVQKELIKEARSAVRAEEIPQIRQQIEREFAAKVARRPTVSAVLSSGALLGLNYAADAAPGFWLAAEARGQRWSMMLEARGVFPSLAYAAPDGSGAADLASFSAIGSPCVRYKVLAGCAVVELGSVWTAGPKGALGSSVGPLFGLGVRARLDVPLGAGFEARLFGDGIGQLLRLSPRGTVTTAAGEEVSFAYEAPRAFSLVMGLGLARSFD
jgi:hypothetical protein